MPPVEIPQIEIPQIEMLPPEDRPSWAMRSLNGLAILAIMVVSITCVRTFVKYRSAQRAAEVLPVPLVEPMIVEVQLSPKELKRRRMLQETEQRMTHARQEKETRFVSNPALELDPQAYYNRHLDQVQHSIDSLADQPGLAAPLQRRLEGEEADRPLKPSRN